MGTARSHSTARQAARRAEGLAVPLPAHPLRGLGGENEEVPGARGHRGRFTSTGLHHWSTVVTCCVFNRSPRSISDEGHQGRRGNRVPFRIRPKNASRNAGRDPQAQASGHSDAHKVAALSRPQQRPGVSCAHRPVPSPGLAGNRADDHRGAGVARRRMAAQAPGFEVEPDSPPGNDFRLEITNKNLGHREAPRASEIAAPLCPVRSGGWLPPGSFIA